MTGPILNLADVDFMNWGHGVAIPGAKEASEHYQAHIGFIGPKVGARQLGYNLTVVPPGKRAFPFHSHRVNEEMFFVLEGNGDIRIGEKTYPIRQGDIVACPAGGPETAHQIVNTSGADIKYLAVSTRRHPEIVDYPTTGRFGVLSEEPAGPDGGTRSFRFVGRPADSLDYWQGE